MTIFEELMLETDKLKNCIAITLGENQCEDARENYKHKALVILKVIGDAIK